MDGFYDRLVGLVKKSLKKSIDRSIMNLVQIQTMQKEVESVVNSRPLSYVDDDVHSNITLTPGLFCHQTQKLEFQIYRYKLTRTIIHKKVLEKCY